MINKFVEECNENIYDAKLTEITLHIKISVHVFTQFLLSWDVIVFTICIGISTYFV